MFLDETAISTSMTRRGGRSARGQRLVCKVPFGSWQSVTMVAALRHDRVTAPMTLNGAMTGESFRSYIEQVLGPTLRRGDIVVMDNVPLHRTQAVREALGKLGVLVPEFPAYSPDLNPIEQAIAKLKAFLRKLAPRSPRRLTAALRDALQQIRGDVPLVVEGNVHCLAILHRVAAPDGLIVLRQRRHLRVSLSSIRF